MGSYKHIEHAVGEYIAARYSRAIEAGIGNNTDAAELVAGAGALKGCTDIRPLTLPPSLNFHQDDIFDPDMSHYRGADVIFAIRPAIEMLPPLIRIASEADCDLVVYHLGFEQYGDGGEKIDCGVLLHRYRKRSEPVKEG